MDYWLNLIEMKWNEMLGFGPLLSEVKLDPETLQDSVHYDHSTTGYNTNIWHAMIYIFLICNHFIIQNAGQKFWLVLLPATMSLIVSLRYQKSTNICISISLWHYIFHEEKEVFKFNCQFQSHWYQSRYTSNSPIPYKQIQETVA